MLIDRYWKLVLKDSAGEASRQPAINIIFTPFR